MLHQNYLGNLGAVTVTSYAPPLQARSKVYRGCISELERPPGESQLLQGSRIGAE